MNSLKKNLTIAAAMLLISIAGNVLHAQTSNSQTLSYQGVLKTTTGNQTAGNRLLKVTLYSDADGNNKLWQNTMNTLVDENGVFNALLGTPDNPLPSSADMDRPIWLGLSIDNGPELRPLSQITASAYALNVADNAITSQKLATGAVTADKLDMNYVSSISVNGQKVTGKASDLNIVAGDGVNLVYDDASKMLLLNTSGSATNTGGKGANAESAATEWQLAGNTLTASGVLGSLSGSTPLTWEEIVKGQTVEQFQYDPAWAGSGASTPDIIGGWGGNSILETSSTAATGGNFIGGGGGGTFSEANQILYSHWATIGGGLGNLINGAYGYDSANQLKFQVIGGGEKNDAGRKYAAILGGDRNFAFGEWSSIGGGHVNVITGETEKSTIAGGDSNTITDWNSSIGGGHLNYISSGNFSAIAGGRKNLISSANGSIAGGDSNTVSETHGSIGGGLQNNAIGSGYSSIGGGRYNRDFGSYSTIAGGDTNLIDVGESSHSNYDAIGGGLANTIGNSDTAIIGGGAHNSINNGKSGTIGGGTFNGILGGQGDIIGGGHDNNIGAVSRPTSNFSAIGGGFKNLIVGGDFSAIGGGDTNISVGQSNSIGGGARNATNANFSHIGGGDTNVIDNFNYSAISGGERNHIIGLVDTDIKDHSFIGGGLQNTIEDSRAAIGGGESNFIDADAHHSFIGGGRQNLIQGPFSAIGGGDSNSIIDPNADHNVIGGGFKNIEDNPSFGVIAGGVNNFLDVDAYGSTISGGDSNRIHAIVSFIGSGAFNVIDGFSDYSVICGGTNNEALGHRSVIVGGDSNLTNAGPDGFPSIVGGKNNSVLGKFGFVGGGLDNSVSWQADSSVVVGGSHNLVGSSVVNSFVGGGSVNSIFAHNATLGGGFTNTILSGGPFAAIPGGDSLTAQSFAQTVVGYNNLPAGGFTQGSKNDFTNNPTHADDPLFIVGNGNDGTHHSDAFTISYDGHTSVFDVNGSGGASGSTRSSIAGGTFVDNTVLAWGEVPAGGVIYPNPITTGVDFGVFSITHTALGEYDIVLNVINGNGTLRTLSGICVTVTPMDPPTGSPVCMYATSTSLIAPGPNEFKIHIHNASDCSAVNNAFMFKVTGR